jgi:hypothetical protein
MEKKIMESISELDWIRTEIRQAKAKIRFFENLSWDERKEILLKVTGGFYKTMPDVLDDQSLQMSEFLRLQSNSQMLQEVEDMMESFIRNCENQ